jgi:hypothetical protein
MIKFFSRHNKELSSSFISGVTTVAAVYPDGITREEYFLIAVSFLAGWFGIKAINPTSRKPTEPPTV